MKKYFINTIKKYVENYLYKQTRVSAILELNHSHDKLHPFHLFFSKILLPFVIRSH